jgi:RND family efflux transporter MFP subunit
MNRWLKVVLPVAVILIGALGAGAMMMSRKAPQTRTARIEAPMVRTMDVVLQDLRLTVRSQGTVSPRTESTLVPEVAGRVIYVYPSFASGGFFETETVLLKIDPHDYRQALIQTHAGVAQAELRLAREEAEADVAREEWSDLGQGEASALTLHVPQIAEATAAVAAARSAVVRAERDLERTMIRAPYEGRVRAKQVDLGQYVTPGTPLATIYAVDFAEVRLPLPDAELAFVDLPLVYRGADTAGPQPEVILRAEFAGKVHRWHGRIVRTEGEIDPKSRMVHTVAQVRDPYGRGEDPDRPPLAAGMYVEAEIIGREVSNVAVIPRTAIRNGDQVLIVDADNRLRFRKVEILRYEDEWAIVAAGLAAGERISISNLATVTDGMSVRVAEPAGNDG